MCDFYAAIATVIFSTFQMWRYRGYYMAAWGYEISLQVLKNISRASTANEWDIFNTRREILYLQAAMQ